MRPFDRRLLAYAVTVRSLLAAAVASAFLQAVLVIAQASLLASVVDDVLMRHRAWADISTRAGWLAAVLGGRALVTLLSEWSAARASMRARGELRGALAAKLTRIGPVTGSQFTAGQTAVLAVSGVDALDGYFARFLPQLGTALAVPLATWAVIARADTLSAVIIALTVPLVPFFMVLVGRHTQAATGMQWQALGRLSGHLLDVLTGLTTLRLFGRARRHTAAVRTLGDRHRRATTRVLRTTFLSALVLELLATISIALVAVSIGLRLLAGHMSFRDGLLVLLLAPEVYQPLRSLGTHYHAAADGAAAAARIIEVLQAPEPASGTRTLPDVAAATIAVDGVDFSYPDAAAPVLTGLTARFAPGQLSVITGPSGCGKSTLLALLLKFAEPQAGCVRVGGVDVRELDTAWWRAQIAYVPQHPWLPSGSLRDAVRMARPDASDEQVLAVCRRAGLVDGDGADELSLSTEVGDGGRGVSLGQRRRIALARALLKDAPIVVLDEPTASLDEAAEDAVVREVLALRDAGATVISVQHRRSLIDAADQVVALQAAAVFA